MNDTAPAGGATGASLIPSTTDAFTYAHIVVMAIFALAVIAAIVWGMRLKRQRKAAEHAIAAHNVEVEEQATNDPVAPPPAPRSAPQPVVSAPPPIVDPAPAALAHPLADDGTIDRPVEDRVTAPPASDPVEEPATPVLADEPIPASAPLDASPATEAASAPVADRDDPAAAPLSMLKGLGPKLQTRLAELGITTVGQVAALTDDEAMRLDAQLGPFSGRMTRDRWIEQARFLAAGDQAGFEAVFGRL